MDRRLATVTNRWFFAAITVLLFGFYVFQLAHSGQLGGPPHNTHGDEPDYDNIACSLRKHRTFSYDYHDPDFLAPYQRTPEAGNPRVAYPERVAFQPTGPMTYRPPLLPVILALTYGGDLSNRPFHRFRILNALAAALTIGLACWLCRSEVGSIASLLCLGLMVRYGISPRDNDQLATERLSGLLTTLALVSLVRSSPGHRVRGSVVLGLIWSVAILLRTSAILWTPALVAALWWKFHTVGVFQTKTGFLRWVVSPIPFLVVIVVVMIPWSIRNCLVLQTFMPLGCQGLIELPKGFSDQAVANAGVWVDQPPTSEADVNPSRTEGERLAAEAGRARAIGWIKTHLRQIPALTVHKLWSEWNPRSAALAWIYLLAVIGFWCYRSRPLGWACFAIILGDILMIAATWSVGGRFVYPTIGAVYCLAGAGFWAVLRLIVDFRGQIVEPS